MPSLLGQWISEMRRRLRQMHGETEAEWPAVPPSVLLNPSDADFVAYRHAALALTWRRAGDDDTTGWQTKVRTKLRELLGIASGHSPTDRAPITGARLDREIRTLASARNVTMRAT